MMKQHGMAIPSTPLYTQVILCALEKGTTSGSLNQNKVPTSMGGWSEKVPALCGWCLTGLSCHGPIVSPRNLPFEVLTSTTVEYDSH